MHTRHAFSLLFLALGLLAPAPALAQTAAQTAATGDAVPSARAADDTLEAAPATEDASGETATDDVSTTTAQEAPELNVSINGSLRFNALFRSYNTPSESANNEILGDGGFTFDTFRIGASGSYGGLIFDAEYAIYPETFGGLFIHHGWVGYQFSDDRQVQVGVSQVPFGIQPYASSSWFFNIPYYVGLEDDYDAGVKAIYTPGSWELKGAYYMNAEGTDFFAGQTFSRYSYDVAPVSAANYQVVPGGNDLRSDITEEHQFNGKVTYTFDHGDLGFTKVGASGQRGALTNQATGETEWSSAYALHVQGRYEGFEAKLEFAQQDFDPPLDDEKRRAFNAQPDVDYNADDFVVMGAYAFPQRVASEHTLFSSSLAYHLPLDWGPVSQIKPYYDFSLLTKEVDGWNDNVTHDIGVLTSAGPLYLYTDLNVSKGHPFNYPGIDYASVTAENNDDEWRVAFNMNIGIYF